MFSLLLQLGISLRVFLSQVLWGDLHLYGVSFTVINAPIYLGAHNSWKITRCWSNWKKKFDDVLLTFCGKRAQAKGTMNMRKQPTPITWQRNVSLKANERRMKERRKGRRKKKRNLERTVESWSRFEPRLLLHLLEMIMVSMVTNHKYYDYNGQWQFMNDKMTIYEW